MTSGPNSFKGRIGKAINEDLRLLPIAKFQPLNGSVNKLPEIIISELCTDQSFLYHICMTVQHGREYLLYHNVTSNSPGALNQARWLTKANKILYLFPNPSKELIMITSFILTFYTPIWFHIKEHSSCIDGAKNFFFILQLLKDQPPQIQEVVRPVLQHNSFWAHPENILLCQIHDDDISIRQDAISKVIRAREYARNEQEPKLGNFISPKIDWTASNYFTMAE